MFSFPGRKGSQATLIDAELDNLSNWAQREWPLRWGENFGMADLKDHLDAFLPDGLDHARTQDHLEDVTPSVIARALLIGIARAGTHSKASLEVALGVPLPRTE